jgi:hypothetical protein
MPTKKVIGVIGKGNASLNIIEDSLSELVNDSIFVLPWYGGKPDESLDRVYTAIIDFGHEYIMVGNRIPRSVLKDAKDWEDTEDANSAVLSYVQRLAGEKSLLVLWDDSPETEDTLLKAHASGIRLLDLTNALAPIDVVDVQEVVETPEVPAVNTAREEALAEALADINKKYDSEVTAPESGAFTEAELRSQPIASLRRQAKLLGIEIEKTTTKEQLIGILLNGLDDIGLVEPVTKLPVTKLPVTALKVTVHRSEYELAHYMFSSENIPHVEQILGALQMIAPEDDNVHSF